MAYFSERDLAQKPRTRETLSVKAWIGLIKIINTRIGDGSFGKDFPQDCYFCTATVGTNEALMAQAVRRELPFLDWPLDPDWPWHDPDLGVNLYDALDLVQFCYRVVSSPLTTEGFCNRSDVRHLSFDDEKGRREFRDVVNRIFARESLTFHLEESGEVARLAPLVLHEALASVVFNTGDKSLDVLLEEARHKFLNPDVKVRRESLERLWDAWERLKTVENPSDKAASAAKLLDRASAEPNFRQVLEKEARALTVIGNGFMIRHTEIGKTPIGDSDQVDYLFHRLFSIIRLLLRSTNRGG